MAVRIPVYTQQTRTPGTLVSGGNISTDTGPNIGNALGDIAQGVGMLSRMRIQEREELDASQATAYAAQAAAQFASDTMRDEEAARTEVGAGAAGYNERVMTAAQERQAQILADAPNEKARTFLTNQFRQIMAQVDERSYGYEIGEGRKQVIETYGKATEAAAGVAAMSPDRAQLEAAQQLAVIRADKSITEDQRRVLEDNAVQAISEGAVLGDLLKNPYAAERALMARLNLTGDDDGQVDAGVVGGLMAEANRRAQAGEDTATIDAWFNESMTKAGIKVDTSRAGEDVPEDGRGWAYSKLSVPKVVELLSRARSDIARLENEREQEAEFGKITLDQQYQDQLAALKTGQQVSNVPSLAQLQVVYGEEKGAIKAREFAVAQSLSGDLQRMNGQTNEELAATVSTPPSGPENFEFRADAYRIRAGQAQAILTARNADPGGYVLATNKPVAFAYEQMETLAADPQASPQDVLAAQARYLGANAAEQARMGVEVPKLPVQFVEFSKKRLTEGLTGDNPQFAVAQLEATAQSLVGQPDMLNQLVEATGDLGHLAVNGVGARTLMMVQNAAKTPEKDKKDLLLANGYTWTQVESAVAAEFAPLYATFANGMNNENSVMYTKAAQALVAERVLAGESPEQAARGAYIDLYADKNAVVGKLRVDMRQADPELVQNGLDGYVRDLSPDAVAVEVQPWMDDSGRKVARETMVRTIRRSAFWVNDSTGQNAMLMWANGPVNGADGNPIMIPITEAAQYQPRTPRRPRVGDADYTGPIR